MVASLNPVTTSHLYVFQSNIKIKYHYYYIMNVEGKQMFSA